MVTPAALAEVFVHKTSDFDKIGAAEKGDVEDVGSGALLYQVNCGAISSRLGSRAART